MKKKRNEEKDMTKDFFEALDILEKERKISKEYLLKKIKDALATAYKKETGLSNIAVNIDEEAGKIKICKVLEVYDPVAEAEAEAAALAALAEAEAKKAEAEALCDPFTLTEHKQGVQCRILGVPEYGIVYQHVVARILSAVGGDHRYDNGGALLAELAVNAHSSLGRGVDKEIGYMVFGSDEHIDVSENSIVTEAILILQIGAVAPLVYENGDLVFAILYRARYPELALQV